MQIKNKKNIIILYFLILFFSSLILNAEEFNISAKEILINKDGKIEDTFSSLTNQTSNKIISKIEELLKI